MDTNKVKKRICVQFVSKLICINKTINQLSWFFGIFSASRIVHRQLFYLINLNIRSQRTNTGQ